MIKNKLEKKKKIKIIRGGESNLNLKKSLKTAW